MSKQSERSSDKYKLSASEQQLKALNQQLQVSEQQLRAANQQLEASNRQLRGVEEEFRKSRELYKTMFEGTINAIAVYEAVDGGSDFVFRDFNPAAEKIENKKKEDLLGKRVLDMLPGVKKFGLFDVIQRVWKTGKAEHYSETIHSDGLITGWRENYVFRLPSGEIVAVYEDITDKKRAEQMQTEEHNLLRTLIDNLPDSVYIKDTRGRFVISNVEASYRVGVASPDEMIGKTDFDFYPAELASRYYADEQDVIKTGQPLLGREEPVINQTTGETIWNLTTKIPWRDSGGTIVGILGIGRNITERKRMEDELKAANQQLQVSEQQLRAANQQLQASDQQLRAANQQLQASEQQFKAANQQLRANEQQLKAANQQLQVSEDELRRLNDDLRKRVKELNCLYGLSRLAEVEDSSLEQIFREVVNLAAAAWQYPEAAAARIIFEGQSFKTDNFQETPWTQCADIKMYGRKAGTIQVCYLEEKPDIDEGPFFVEERNLLDALAEHLGDIAERKDAEGKLFDYQSQLKSLASELSLTEERERRRIATELHDRISQFLVISKVKLETLRKSASSADIVKALSEVCESIDQTIQNTRSLTFDLSSPILYELGFEAAVAEWLDEHVYKKHGIAAEFLDDGQPKPLDDDIRVFLFRDVRELLINVVKHAHARKVKVSSRKVGSEIHVSVEDDGTGFNVSEITSIATKTGGFGLFSIRERLEQLGGRLKIESEAGRGTKVTIIAPLKQGKNNSRELK